jgi:hypothetical protein
VTPLRPVLAAAAAFTIASLALHTMFASTLPVTRWVWGSDDPDCAERHAARFERVRALIPAHGVLMFVGAGLEDGPPAPPTSWPGGCHVAFVAQRTLAPVLLVEPDAHEFIEAVRSRDLVVPTSPSLVLVDTESPQGKAWLSSHNGHRTAADVGNGLVLVTGSE